MRIALLDEDHVLGVVRDAVRGADVAAFFAPEPVNAAPIHTAALGFALAAPEDAEVLLLRRATVDAALLNRCPHLRLVQRLGERRDRIDVAACAARGIAVSCLPRPSLIRTAEHAILLMLALRRRLLAADAAVRRGAPTGAPAGAPGDVAYNWPHLAGVQGLYGATLGIIGLGEVGALVAQRAAAFGMRVLYAGRRRLPPEVEMQFAVEWRALDTLLGEADIVSIHASNLPENRGGFGVREMRLMRPGALLVNTSRGALLDEAALLDALRDGHLGGAGLDVHAAEPRAADDLLLAAPNLVLTPHIAGGSRLDIVPEILAILANCRAVRDGAPALHGHVLP